MCVHILHGGQSSPSPRDSLSTSMCACVCIHPRAVIAVRVDLYIGYMFRIAVTARASEKGDMNCASRTPLPTVYIYASRYVYTSRLPCAIFSEGGTQEAYSDARKDICRGRERAKCPEKLVPILIHRAARRSLCAPGRQWAS